MENQKAEAFVGRLLSNPALQQFNALQREEQIIQFLHSNSAQLAPTLASQSFFPGKGWNEILGLLLQALMRYTDQGLVPDLRRIVTEQINFSFVQFLRQQNLPYPKIHDQVVSILTGLLKKPMARRGFTGPYSALSYRVIDRYVDEAFRRKSYVHFELTKVQRLRMSKEEVKAMIEATLLLKPTIHLMATEPNQSRQENLSGVVQGQFAAKVFTLLKEHAKLLPDQLLKSAVNSNISFGENRFIEATARVAAIFAARARNYQPNVRVDRGADTPDKSWFSIARRNHKFYGFDVKMLDEFYKVAAENGW